MIDDPNPKDSKNIMAKISIITSWGSSRPISGVCLVARVLHTDPFKEECLSFLFLLNNPQPRSVRSTLQITALLCDGGRKLADATSNTTRKLQLAAETSLLAQWMISTSINHHQQETFSNRQLAPLHFRDKERNGLWSISTRECALSPPPYCPPVVPFFCDAESLIWNIHP